MYKYLLFLFLIPYFLQAQIMGKVVHIIDGDTFIMIDSLNKQTKIRLHGIDCPENGQDFYQVAKDFLSQCIFKKIVTIENLDVDRYGRIIAKVWINNEDINLKILKAGLAWHYKYYDKSLIYAEAENEAKRNKLGIWSLKNAQPPWEFRKANVTLKTIP